MKTIIATLTLLFLAGTLTPPRAEVNPDGSFSYSLPIEVPEGRLGVQPKLSLQYNSNAGNGMVGFGWSLSGLMAITRMNYGNGINYGKAGYPADTYAGPEGRLIELGSGTGIFHAETETWSKYEASGNCGNGPCSWMVTDRKGMKFFYGLTSNSRIIAKDANNNEIHNGAVRVWALERVEDLNGNYYEITYKKDAGLLYDNGQYYPERISYTLANGVSKNYAISFFYDETGRPDKEISYAQAAFVQTNWRLSKIAVDYQASCFWLFTCNDRVRSYVLAYDTSASNSVSRLLSWHEFDGNNLTLPAVTFNWYDTPINFDAWSANLGKASANFKTTFADINGDGKADMIGYAPDGGTSLQFRLSTDTGFAPWSPDISKYSANAITRFVDINGDGKADMIAYAPDGGTYLHFRLSTGTGFGPWSIDFGKASANYLTEFADLNGDGKADIIGYAPDGAGSLQFRLSTGTGFGPWSADIGKASANSLTTFADINGDGKADIIGYAPNGGTYLQFRLSTGTGFGPWSADFGKASANYKTTFADINGDGKADMIGYAPDGGTSLQFRLSTGTGFAPWSSDISKYSANAITIFVDMNGDGKADMIAYAPDGGTYLHFRLSTGTGFGPWSVDFGKASANYLTEFADLNGDGKADMIGYAPDGAGSLQIRQIGQGPNNLLAQIVLSNGQILTTQYASSSILPAVICITNCVSPDNSSLNYLQGIPSAPSRYLTTSATRMSNMNLDGANGNDSVTSIYEYYNGRMVPGFLFEQTSLGFEKIKTIDVNSNKFMITTYRQDKPFHGLASVTRNYLSTGELVSEHINATPVQYLCDESGCIYDPLKQGHPSKPRQLRYMDETETRAYENGTLVSRKEDEVMQYDAYGNALATRSQVYSNWNQRTTYKFINYINETATINRAVGLSYSETVCLTPTPCSESSPNFVSGTLNYFDGQALGQVGANHRLTKRETFISTGMSGSTQTGIWAPEVFTHNALGLVTSKTDASGVITTLTYDSADYFQYPESMVKSHGGKTLTTTQVFDKRFGKKKSETNADDNVTIASTIDDDGFVSKIETFNGSTLLSRKTFAHSPYNAQPFEMTECTFYGTGFLSSRCTTKKSDAFRRVFREEFPEMVPPAGGGEAVETQMAIEKRYDARGRVVQTSQPFAVQGGSPTQWNTTTYDEHDRTMQMTSFDGKTTQVQHQNFSTGFSAGTPVEAVTCTRTTLPDSKVDITCEGIWAKPVFTQSSANTNEKSSVIFHYDDVGRVNQMSTPQGTTLIQYIGRSTVQATVTDPVSGTTQYEYDFTVGQASFGKLIRETRPSTINGLNSESLYEYNTPFGRVSKLTKGLVSTPLNLRDSVMYTYDNTANTFGHGRLTQTTQRINGFEITEDYRYNGLGENVQIIRKIAKPGETLCNDPNAMPCTQIFGLTTAEADNDPYQQKDAIGRKKIITYPDGIKTTINYFAGSENVASISHDGVTYASYSNYTYDVTSHVGKITYGNGLEHSYTYNPANSVNPAEPAGFLKTTVIGKPSATPYVNLTYAYDAALNITGISDAITPNLSTTFQYDDLNRLKSATLGSGDVRSYAFDLAGSANSKGNLSRKDNRRLTYATGKTYPASDELYNETNSQWETHRTYTWSENGNLLTKGPFTFSYDTNNMLTHATEVDPQNTSTVIGDTKFFYDQSGRRFLKTHTRGGITIKTWYMGDGMEMREKYTGVSGANPTGSFDSWQATKYIYGVDGKRVASVTGNVKSTPPTTTTSSMFAMAEGYSSSTFTGIAMKTYYTFYGIYAHENFSKIARICCFVTLALFLILWLVRHEGKKLSRTAQFVFPIWQRMTASALVVAFFTVNCGAPLPPGVTQGDVAGLMSDLYTGLPAGTVYYSHNHLGSGLLLTNGQGDEIFRVTYSEYGEIDLTNSGKWNPTTQLFERNMSDAELLITAVKYTGQEYDPETGLYYYNARYYDPELGVFTSADTKLPKNPTGLDFNRHMYVRGNPIKYTDPSGHFAFLAALFFAIAKIVKAAIIVGAIAYTKAVIQNKGNFKAVSASVFWSGAAVGALSALGGMAAGALGGIGNFGSTFANHLVQQATEGAISGGTQAIANGSNFLEGVGKGFVKGAVSGSFDGFSNAAQSMDGGGASMVIDAYGVMAKNGVSKAFGEGHTDFPTAFASGFFVGAARLVNYQASKDEDMSKIWAKGQKAWEFAKKIPQVNAFAERMSGESPFREYLQRSKGDVCINKKTCYDYKAPEWGDIFEPISKPIQNYVNDISAAPEKAKEAWNIISNLGELTKQPEKVSGQIANQAAYWQGLSNVPFAK